MAWSNIGSDMSAMFQSRRGVNEDDVDDGDPYFSQPRNGKSFFNCADDYYAFTGFRFCQPSQFNTPDYKQHISKMFHNEPCIYGHRVFTRSAAIYAEVRRLPPPNFMNHQHSPVNDVHLVAADEVISPSKDITVAQVTEFEFESRAEKRLAFQLVFQTLKYEKFLREMLENSKFFESNQEFSDELAVVMVMLCDFTIRKFQRRVESTRNKMMLAELSYFNERQTVALANDPVPYLTEIEDALFSMATIQVELKLYGLHEVKSEEELSGATYLLDEHCDDLIHFPCDLLEFIELTPIVTKRQLIIQDKSSSLGVHSIRRMMGDDDDVIHVNVGSGITTAHLASLTHGSETTIYAFGVQSDRQQQQINANLKRFGCRSAVKLVLENFVDIDITDDRFKDIKLVLVTAQCSRSGVTNPVNFIVNEGEDVNILRDLAVGQTNPSKLVELVNKQTSVLKHALQLPRVQAVVYSTWSLLNTENADVISACVDQSNAAQQTKTPFRVGPPVLPLAERDIDTDTGPLVGKYIKFMPSYRNFGCFTSAITREADDPKEAAKGILARAAARGIISGFVALPPTSSTQNMPRNKTAQSNKPKALKSSHRKKSVSLIQRPTSQSSQAAV